MEENEVEELTEILECLLVSMQAILQTLHEVILSMYCEPVTRPLTRRSVTRNGAGKIVVELNSRLNKCGVISPRFDVSVKDIESWTAKLLPSRQLWAITFCPLEINLYSTGPLQWLEFGYRTSFLAQRVILWLVESLNN
ncbi:hypothetical protein Syun_009394 [Stephania yunnanensis]|uniref:Uncharacterized protein n=1 Tax=Stephania yunnanensis TaxID=152371 RepID=A0AAP0KFG8_9MAGN